MLGLRRLLPPSLILPDCVLVCVGIALLAVFSGVPLPAEAPQPGGPIIIGHRVLEISAVSGPLSVTVFATPSGIPLVLNVDKIVLVDEDSP